MLEKAGTEQEVTRLRRIDEDADQVDFAVLERRLDRERTIEEFTAKRSRRVHLLHAARNTLAVMPLLITWLALAWASIEYSNELAHYPGQVTKPFLLLWQQHFGGSSIPTFATFGAADFALLSVVFGFTILVHRDENLLLKQQTEIGGKIDSAMSDLATAVSGTLGNRSPANAAEWANEVGRVIDVAMRQTETLAEAGRSTIEQASRDLTAVYTEEREFIKTFSEAIREALVNAQDQYQQFMKNTAIEVTKAIEQQMNPLLGRIDGLVTEISRHHETYRNGVAELTQGIAAMSQSAVALATSARDHAQVSVTIGANLEKVAQSQRDFADQVSKSVASMDSSAKAMASTAELLRGEVMSGLKDVGGNVVTASHDLKVVQGHLATTTAAFSTTAQALGSSTAALGAATRELRAAADALRSSSRGGPSIWRRISRASR